MEHDKNDILLSNVLKSDLKFNITKYNNLFDLEESNHTDIMYNFQNTYCLFHKVKEEATKQTEHLHKNLIVTHIVYIAVIFAVIKFLI